MNTSRFLKSRPSSSYKPRTPQSYSRTRPSYKREARPNSSAGREYQSRYKTPSTTFKKHPNKLSESFQKNTERKEAPKHLTMSMVKPSTNDDELRPNDSSKDSLYHLTSNFNRTAISPYQSFKSSRRDMNSAFKNNTSRIANSEVVKGQGVLAPLDTQQSDVQSVDFDRNLTGKF